MLNAGSKPWFSDRDLRGAEDQSGRRPSDPTALAEAVLEATASLLIVTEIGTGHVVAMNQAVEHLTGYRREEVIGLPLWEIVAPAQQAGIRRALTDPAGHSLPESYESTVNLRSGRPRRIVWSSTFLKDANGVRQHVVMTGIDVSSESATGGLFAHLMMAANTTAMVSTDRRGRVTYFSSAVERMLGLRGDHLIGKPLPDAVFDTSELQSRAVELQAPTLLEMLTHTEAAMPTPSKASSSTLQIKS